MQSEDGHNTLVKALKRGSTAAFEQVYERYKRPLYATALRYLKDNQLAEDVLQDVFVKLWQNRQALDEQLSLKNYLFVCLKNQVLNRIRSEQVRIKAALLANQFEEGFSRQTESEVALNDLQAWVNTSLSTLPARKRQIVQLSLIEGYSNQEIAAVLQISENTVRSQLSQAKKLIRNFLQRALTVLVFLYF